MSEVQVTEAGSIHADIRSVKHLFESSGEAQKWIIENLVREGDQVVLAGPPKSGKSFLAFQLAMAVATGRNHTGEPFFLIPEFKISQATALRKVLFFSLEMGPGVMKSRLMPWNTLKAPGAPSAPDLSKIENLKYVFSVAGRSTLQLELKDSQSYKVAQKLIAEETPDLLIFDTFVRVHSLDENDNVKMAALMENLLNLCEIEDSSAQSGKRRIAHVIVHHLRKLGPDWKHNRSIIDAVRGAGSIIGAADLILGMNVINKELKLRKLEFCCRHLAMVEDLILAPSEDKDGPVVFQRYVPPTESVKADQPKGPKAERRDRLIKAISEVLTKQIASSQNEVSAFDLSQPVAKLLNDKPPGAEMFVGACAGAKVAGWRFHQESGKGLCNNKWERVPL